MTGARSHAGNEKDQLRRLANASRKRHQKWVESGSPPAHECRLMGESEDDRSLYYPFANLVQRFLNDL
eukprot:6896688-Pyramimonas_sp.AAC.1